MERKGFIFDLDGVIVDTAKYHFLAWKKLANSIGVDFTSTQNEQLKGVSRKASLEKILAWGQKEISAQEFDRLMQVKNKDYLDFISHMNADEILVDVPRVLAFLEANAQGIALGSASKNAQVILEKVELLHHFQALVGGNDVVHGKPHPEVFLKGAEGLKINPASCVVFEDSVAGIQAAKAAGMYAVGIGDKNVLTEADLVVQDFTALSNEKLKEMILST